MASLFMRIAFDSSVTLRMSLPIISGLADIDPEWRGQIGVQPPKSVNEHRTWEQTVEQGLLVIWRRTNGHLSHLLYKGDAALPGDATVFAT